MAAAAGPLRATRRRRESRTPGVAAGCGGGVVACRRPARRAGTGGATARKRPAAVLDGRRCNAAGRGLAAVADMAAAKNGCG